MRILVVDSVYPAFVEDLYRRVPELESASYREQLECYWRECFGTGDGYVRHLADAGQQSLHVLCNCVPTQAAWLRERGRRFDPLRRALSQPGRLGRDAQRATVLVQVERLRPDVLFIDDLWEVSDRMLAWLRTRVPYLVGQIASHPPPIERMQRFDLMLSSFPHYVRWFRSAGIDSELFPLGFMPRVLEELHAEGVSTSPDAPGRKGVVFVGGLNPKIYPSVTPALERLCAEVDVDVRGYDADRLAAGSAIRARYRGTAWGMEMYRLLARARVVVNRHGDIAEGYANNMRLFEATGVGATLVTEAAPNLANLFEPDREVVTYADGDELVERVQALLADEAHAVRIAAAGQRRTLREHTYVQRMSQLAELLEDRYAAGRFRARRSSRYHAS